MLPGAENKNVLKFDIFAALKVKSGAGTSLKLGDIGEVQAREMHTGSQVYTFPDHAAHFIFTSTRYCRDSSLFTICLQKILI